MTDAKGFPLEQEKPYFDFFPASSAPCPAPLHEWCDSTAEVGPSPVWDGAGISKGRGDARHSIKSLKKLSGGWFRTAAVGIFRQMPWSIPLGRKRAPTLLFQWDFPWMMTPVLPLGQVSPGDEEEQDALVACHRPGGEYGLVCPIPPLCFSGAQTPPHSRTGHGDGSASFVVHPVGS